MSFTPVSSLASAVISGSVSVTNFPATQPVSIAATVLVDGSGHTQPVSGTVDVNNFPATQPVSIAAPVAVTGPLTDTQLRASAVPISAAALPLPAGAATDASLTNGNQRVGGTVTVDGSGHTQPVSGTVTANQGTAGTAWPVDASGVAVPVTGPLTNAQLRASAVPVDGSAVTQPVSAVSLPLPTGAAKETTQVENLRSINDVALTAILQREQMEAA